MDDGDILIAQCVTRMRRLTWDAPFIAKATVSFPRLLKVGASKCVRLFYGNNQRGK